jgi:hypothetical protein
MRDNNKTRMIVILLLSMNMGLYAFLSACSSSKSSGPAPSSGPSSGSSPSPAEGQEVSYDGTPVTVEGPHTRILVQAFFRRISDEKRFNEPGVLETWGIPHAEFWILNAQGQIIQKGETSEEGKISALIPKTAGSYTVQIRSRAFNAHYKASILNTPYEKKVYQLNYSFSLNGTEEEYPPQVENLEASPPVTLPVHVPVTADYQGDTLGGAFNILYNIYLATQFLSNLNPKPQIPKAQVYWVKGLTPATYFKGSGGISFYVAQASQGLYEGLYILGGENGSVCTDTDHFDNSVILHEFAHFLEHKMSRTDSPGGAHDGSRIIDPRLAWSEGFSNYFQGAVLNRPFYRDTLARGCHNEKLNSILFDLVKTSSFVTTPDIPTLTGEGSFREMAIARYLFGVTSSHESKIESDDSPRIEYGGLNHPFQKVWTSFLGLGETSLKGRSAHHFNRIILQSFNGSELNTFTGSGSPFSVEKQGGSLSHWAKPLVISQTPCPASTEDGINSQGYTVFTQGQPQGDRNVSHQVIACNTTGTITWSDMFYSNDFYVYSQGEASQENLWIEYQSLSGSGYPYDLDLYLYRPQFTFLNSSDIVKASERFYPEESNTGRESISLSGLPAHSWYFLNIKIDQPSCSRQTTGYRIRLGSNRYLCPSQNLNAN